MCNAWRDGRHYDRSSIVWAFISSLARLRRVEEASPGDLRRFLLSSVVLIVIGEIPGPIFHCGATRLTPMPCTMYGFPLPNVSRKFLVLGRVNVTPGYTLIKTRHSRVPTYLQRETDTADWSMPTFTLPCPKNGGEHPATSTFLQICTPIFRDVP